MKNIIIISILLLVTISIKAQSAAVRVAGSFLDRPYSTSGRTGINFVSGAIRFDINSATAATFPLAGGFNFGSGTFTATAGVVNAQIGFRINDVATTGNYLRGNGTNLVLSGLLPADLTQSGATTNQVLAWSGTAWVPATPTAIVNLDQAYNHFGATSSKINIDASEGQTGGLEFESTGSNNHFTIDLQGSGDFIVQDTGINNFRIFQNGYASFGTVAPGTTQKVLISENTAGTTTTALAMDNNAEPTDGSGTRFAMRLGSTDQFAITVSDPVGSYTRAYDISAYMGGSLQTAITINGNKESTRFNTALEIEIYNGTSTTETLDGKSSSVYIPSSATTTTINLPTIVTGVPAANEVSVGYVLTVYIDRGASVTINSLNSDEMMLDGGTSKVTSTSTTGGTYYVKTFTALASNLWGVK